MLESNSNIHDIMYARILAETIHAVSDSFPVLMLTGPRQVCKPVGSGAVLCFVERDIPLSKDVTAIPVAYL
jgi:hypothetical protein